MTGLELPPEAKVIGELLDVPSLNDLTQDMLQIELPGELFIAVGWYPRDRNPNGHYRVLVFRDTTDDMLMTVKTKDIAIVKESIALALRVVA